MDDRDGWQERERERERERESGNSMLLAWLDDNNDIHPLKFDFQIKERFVISQDKNN